MSQRIRYIDMAKGIGMLAVIIGHMNIWKLNRVIYSFHMPLFFLIAGVFISQKCSNIEYVKKKAKQLLLPYGFTCASLITLSIIKNLLVGTIDNIGGDIQKWFMAALYGSGNIEKYGFKRIGAIWFLLAMFIACVFVKYISDKKVMAPCVILVAFIGYLTSKIVWLPFSIQPAMVASIYVYIGFMIRKKHTKSECFNPLFYFFIVIMWFLTILFGEVNMSRNLYKYGIFSFIGTVCGSYVILMICKWFDGREMLPTAITNMLCFFGRNSLIILCFHLIEMEMFPWGIFQSLLLDVGVLSWWVLILEFLLKVIIAIASVGLVKKNGFLRKVFSLS